MSGIQNILSLQEGALKVQAAALAVMDNGGLDMGDIGDLPKLVSGLKDLWLVDLQQVLPEFKDLDAEERLVLAKSFAEGFDIKNDDTEAAIEQGQAMLLELVSAILLVFGKK